MMLQFDSRDTELLALLHAGLFEAPMWQGFLERLRVRTRADHSAIFFRRSDVPPTASTSVSAGQPRSPHILKLYSEIFHRLDPVPYDTLRVGRVYALSEFMFSDNINHTQYSRDYMKPASMNYKRIMRVTGGTDYNAWLTIWAGKRDFGAATDSLLAALAPHISIALRTFELIETTTMRAHIADEAIRRLNFGWLTLDASGYVVDMDLEAERLLISIHGHAPSPASRFWLPDTTIQRGLSDALVEYAANHNARPRAIRLSGDPSLEMLLIPMRERALSGARTPILVAYLHGDSSDSAQRIHQLIDLFGLTRSEARLALALSRGRSIAEAARELTLTIETARNYSKRIYSKTGARGQSDLVRLILASVVALV